MKKLLEKPEGWSKDIQSAFYEEFPIFANYPLSVDLVQKDYEKGFAVGRISVSPEFIVPVIIDSFILKDFIII